MMRGSAEPGRNTSGGETMPDVAWWGLPAALIVLALVELVKRMGLESRWAGLLAVALGALGGAAAHLYADSPLAQAIVQGVAVGLAAAGLYSTGKHVAGGE